MPQASDSAVWLGMFVSLTAALALGSVLAAAGQLPLQPRRFHAAHATFRRRPYWHAGALAAMLAAVLAAGLGASDGVVCAALAGALAGAWLVRRRNLTRRPLLVALLASGMGFSVVFAGVARYWFSPSSLASIAQANLQRIELYVAVFTGALIFATSAMAFCKLRGVLPRRVPARPGHDMVNAAALLLCAWLGYGFATEQAQPFGLAALLAMSLLASSIGVHVMLSRESSKDHAEPVHERDAAMVRATAYGHRRLWHNSGSAQRLATRVRAARRSSHRSTIGRQR
ncbi:NAD(P)(+) transhydrogenase (Re/Si-specific) subunit beta [Paraburkholderia sp. MPAMCS5]|uniref:NAD(P)(+) transhydrogenase (Re/Si-specific) subunit beta n=1 Tax=Paraburkholderia sp. MPAMCS5 TaxID=3112563 RepID=UPI002E195627|nr:NAD(P)(+) transhydrogenase (Re/Si-specific) subunit beta [Paraburkholderia sp. MPAMCS5]